MSKYRRNTESAARGEPENSEEILRGWNQQCTLSGNPGGSPPDKEKETNICSS